MNEKLDLKEETILKVLLIGILNEVEENGYGLVSAYVGREDDKILNSILKKLG